MRADNYRENDNKLAFPFKEHNETWNKSSHFYKTFLYMHFRSAGHTFGKAHGRFPAKNKSSLSLSANELSSVSERERNVRGTLYSIGLVFTAHVRVDDAL